MRARPDVGIYYRRAGRVPDLRDAATEYLGAGAETAPKLAAHHDGYILCAGYLWHCPVRYRMDNRPAGLEAVVSVPRPEDDIFRWIKQAGGMLSRRRITEYAAMTKDFPWTPKELQSGLDVLIEAGRIKIALIDTKSCYYVATNFLERVS